MRQLRLPLFAVPYVRSGAAIALARSNDTRAVEALVRAAQDSGIIGALGESKHPRIVAALADAARNTAFDLDARRSAVQALVRIRTQPAPGVAAGVAERTDRVAVTEGMQSLLDEVRRALQALAPPP